ncbi:MAG: hypothetical protein HY851_05485 [candidate division Zixibacteria bacterium]|nr:hypothetical protein [candidate division Zixibacteria bacterium]
MAQVSDICLLVVVPELTSIADAYGLYKYLKSQNKKLDCRLLVNRAPSAGDAEYLIERFGLMASKFLGSAPKPIGWLSEHAVAGQSVSQQRAMAQIDQKSIVCQQVRELADTLVDACRQVRTVESTPGLTRAGVVETLPTGINNTAATADIRG